MSLITLYFTKDRSIDYILTYGTIGILFDSIALSYILGQLLF